MQEKLSSKVKGRVWFYAGGKEGDEMIPNMQSIKKEFDKRSRARSMVALDMEAKHNEASWRKFFPEFYVWVMK